MGVEVELAEKLTAELDRVVRESTETLANALPYDQYQQACGMIEAYKQIRFSMIPQILDELQRR